MWYMKQFKLLILLLVIGFVAQSQTNYLPMKSRYRWIAGKFDSTVTIPYGLTPSIRTGGFTGPASLFFKTSDSTVYVYTGTQWISVKGAGGSADSTIFATLYRVDTAKTNIRTILNSKIDSLRRSGLNVQAYKNGTWITQFTDSVGSGTGAVTDSLRFANNELSLYQTGGSDLNVHITPSILDIDSTYTTLAGQSNDSTWRLKSIRIQAGGTTINPTVTDNTINVDMPLLAVDTAGAVTNDLMYIDRTGADTIKFRAESTVTSSSGAFSKLEWFSSDEFAPAVGDSTMVHDSFSGKYLDVYRNGIKQVHVVEDTGWARVNDTTISVMPPFAANEFWHIEARDSTAYTQLVLQDPGGVPATTIAYATSADGGNNGGSGTSRTWSHTVSSGTDRYLFVGIVGDVSSGADDVSSVTYNGVAMTLIAKQLQGATSGNRWQYVYGLANPDAGAHNAVVTFSSAHWILAGSIEYTGVQGVDTYTTSTAFTNSKTTSLTTGVNKCWTVLFSNGNASTQSAGSGSTLRRQAADSFWAWFDSGADITPAGSYSMNTTMTPGSGITHIMISIKPY